MDSEKHLAIVRRGLLTLSNQLADTRGRYEDALAVAQLLTEWDGTATPTGEARGRSLSLAALRDRLAGIRGAEDVLKAIDAATAAGAE